MLILKELKAKTSERMEGAIEALKKDFTAIRTGRASLALLDGITIDYYGTPTHLQQVASLSTPDARQILIQPWESGLIPEIEKAIMKSDLDLTPTSDGKTIRLNIPPLTEERRKQLVKLVKKRSEEGKVAVRNIRRDANDEAKKAEKAEHISEDDTRKFTEEIQKATDHYIVRIDELVKHKENEIMEV